MSVWDRYKSNSPQVRSMNAEAKLLALNSGWKLDGSAYVHPTHGRYRSRDVDGWLDLAEQNNLLPESFYDKWDSPTQ